MQLILSTIAENDLHDITEWYNNISFRTAQRFLDDFENTSSLIENFPNTGIAFRKKFKQFGMKRFPYLVLCETVNDTIIILTVVHERRHPNNRLKNKRR